MPLYTKRCNECGRAVDVVRPVDQRNRLEPCLETIALTEEDGPIICDGLLIRDGVELTSEMALQWSMGRRGFAPRQKLGG